MYVNYIHLTWKCGNKIDKNCTAQRVSLHSSLVEHIILYMYVFSHMVGIYAFTLQVHVASMLDGNQQNITIFTHCRFTQKIAKLQPCNRYDDALVRYQQHHHQRQLISLQVNLKIIQSLFQVIICKMSPSLLAQSVACTFELHIKAH